MKINYVMDERIEFFSSLLTVNDYWNFLAKKFWGKEMMSHPYKDDVIKFFSKFKTDDVFSFLENFCASLNDFSVLLEIPFLISLNETDVPLKNETLEKLKQNESFEKLIVLMRDLYEKSNYNKFFSTLNKSQFDLSTESKNNIEKDLEFLQSYTSIPLESIDIYIAPLILGNFLIPLFSSKISIAISPLDYQDRYVWGKPEEYILKSVIKNISDLEIEKIKNRLIEQQEKFVCTIPYYNTTESIVANLLARIILIRLKTLFYKEDADSLLKIEVQNFPDIKIYYERLIKNEENGKFNLDCIDKVFLD